MLRPEWNVKGTEAQHFITKPVEWRRVDNKNAIHSNIFVCQYTDNMAPLTFHYEALPIVKKYGLSDYQFFFPQYPFWTTISTTKRSFCIRVLLFLAIETSEMNNSHFHFA